MNDNHTPGQNGWNEWSRHVLAELNRLHTAIQDLEDKIEVLKDDFTKNFNEELRKIQVDIAMLQVKSGIWGLVGGLIPVLIYVVMELKK